MRGNGDADRLGVFIERPRTSLEEDELDHRRVVARLREILDDIAPRSGSAVIGLVGAWGSGKTTILNDLATALPSWEVRRLEAWLAGDAASLATDLYTTITSALPKGRRWKSTREHAARLFRAVTPLVGLVHPGAGGLAQGMAERYESAESITELHARLADELATLTTPILVLVDDVDRLQPAELRELLRAMRVVARLPRVSFVLAYDEQSLLDGLAVGSVAVTVERGREYLEKIVQARVEVPPLLPAQARTLFLTAIGSWRSEGMPLTEQEFARVGRQWRWMATVMTTPRRINLVRAQLASTWPVVEQEVDVVDFLTLTMLRLFEPGVYRSLERLRHVLTTPKYVAPHQKEERRAEIERLLDEIVATVPRERQAETRDVVRALFPLWGGGDTHYNGVGEPGYVDRYFYVGVPSDDLSDVAVTNAVDEIVRGAGGNALREVEKKLVDPVLAERLVLKLARRFEALTVEDVPPVVGWLLRAFDSPVGDTWTLPKLIREPLLRAGVPAPVLGPMLREASPVGLNAFLMAVLLGDVEEEAPIGPDFPLSLYAHVLAAEMADRLRGVFLAPPDERTELHVRSAFALLARVHSFEFSEWLKSALTGSRWDALDVAARYVTLTTMDGVAWRAEKFAREPFLRFMPEWLVEQAGTYARLEAGDETDHSPAHENLRQIAANALVSAPPPDDVRILRF